MSEEGLRRAAQLYKDIELSAGIVANLDKIDFYFKHDVCGTGHVIINDNRLVMKIKDVILEHYEELKTERSML